MPGILPMKVIKVGSNAQSRIAQACDRCRSKKIRCDGIRPCCTQCANVGFECKTSDKLSRRAFPRGYTESLEERVRSLEAEVRELNDLLEEKEEKIDILSKIHSDSKSSTVSSPSMDSTSLSESMDDVFTVETSPLFFSSDGSDSCFMGASSGRAFVDAFKRRIHECGKSCAAFNADAFLNLHHETKNLTLLTNASLTPPRLFTDRMVDIFFQEWAPLFPILHKPTFLRMYERFVEDPEQTAEKHQLAQLYLVFGIALVSSEAPDREQLVLCESRWRSAVLDVLLDNSIATMQCLILAQLFCIAKGDYEHLQHYRAMAVSLSGRLGLHQNQKQFSFDALTIEKRKRVFWSLYTIDRFSAASLGLPKLLTEADVLTEYPADIDDDDTLQKGSQPTLPGEHTKISSALALFRVSRILSKVLEKNYPAATSHDLSHASIGALEMELKDWSASLPNHLKLTFIQDKPSPDIIGHRCPLLFLAFYYIRTLIHRPVIGSCPPPKSSSSAIAWAESSKRIIQITRLLRHRHLVFSLCLNKDQVLTLCGLSLLYQRLDLKQNGRLMRDGQELVQEVIVSLAKSNASGAADFTKLAVSMGIKDPLESRPEVSSGIPVSNHGLVSSAAEKERLSDITQTQNQQHRIITASQIDNVSPSDLENRLHDHPFSKTPIPTIARTRYQPKPPPILKSRPNNRLKARKQNLDYVLLDINIPDPFQNQSSGPEKKNDTEKERESRKHEHDGWQSIPILGSVNEAQIYDAMYGGTPLPLSLCEGSSSSSGGGSAVDSEGSRDYARSSGSGHSEWSPIGVEGGGGGGAGFEGDDRMEFRCDGRALMRVKAEGMDVRGEGGGDGDGDADMDVDVEGFGLEDELNRW